MAKTPGKSQKNTCMYLDKLFYIILEYMLQILFLIYHLIFNRSDMKGGWREIYLGNSKELSVHAILVTIKIRSQAFHKRNKTPKCFRLIPRYIQYWGEKVTHTLSHKTKGHYTKRHRTKHPNKRVDKFSVTRPQIMNKQSGLEKIICNSNSP